MFGKAMTAEKRVTKAVVDIMGNDKYCALSGVLMVGTREVSDDVPTACTNGRDEFYGREFVTKLNDAELRFLVIHECYHKLYRHLTTWAWMHEIDPQLANAACDYVVNLKIADDNKDGFAKMPMRDGKPIGLLDEQYRDMDAAAVFHKLRKEQPEDGEDGEEGDGEDESGNKPKGNKGKQGKGKSKTGINGDGAGLDDHDWDGAQALSDEEKKELERDIDTALRQGALLAGKTGSGGFRGMAELLATKVDWREALREFVQTTCTGNDYSTWKRPSRRFIGAGMYMPSGISERIGELVVAIDTSGSIGDRELGQFLGELRAITESVTPEAVRLLYWDTKVASDEKYAQHEMCNIIHSTKPAGGGGTDVTCVCDYIRDEGIKPQAVVVFTDGYLGSDWGTWDVPVLWCITGGNEVVAPVGKTIHVKD